MGRIILARHGEDKDNARGILNGRRNAPLTAKGIVQAYDLMTNIRKSNLKIGVVLSSPLQRAHRTAEICSKGLGVQHVVLDYLVERSHGILEGHPFSDIPLLAKEYKVAYGMMYVVDVEGGETYPELCARASIVLSKLKEFVRSQNTWNDVLVVSHGAISRAMTVVHQGKTWENLFDSPSFTNCEFRILE